MKPTSERSYRGLFWGLVLLGLTLDIFSKYAVFTWLYNGGHGGDQVVVPGLFEILAQYTSKADGGEHVLSPLRTISGPVMPRVNPGALFGIFGQNGLLANAIFATISLAAALAILYWSTLPATARDLSLCSALGLILGGTMGNLYDRVVFNGVRDFIHWHYHDLFDWPVFNIADCCLVCGASLLLSQAFLARPKPEAGDLAQSVAMPVESAVGVE